MAETTNISWTDATFNPWIGCTKVHAGCTNCYAESFAKRYNKAKWGPNGTRVKTSEAYWKQPLKWNREAEESGVRKKVFCASLADVFEDWQGLVHDHHGNVLCVDQVGDQMFFDPDSPATQAMLDGKHGKRAGTLDDVRRDLFRLIDETPFLDWLLLTKRPENVPRMWPVSSGGTHHYKKLDNDLLGPQVVGYNYRDNVWIGTSVSDQNTADAWVPKLLECRDLCHVLFLSVEPLLGQVELWQWLTVTDGLGKLSQIDWVIIGGESGHGARPCDLSWIRQVVQDCKSTNTPCFVKQLGSKPEEWDVARRKPGHGPFVGNTMKDSKGGDPSEWPEDLRIRQFPVVTEATHATP